jgi:hypothetical protein
MDNFRGVCTRCGIAHSDANHSCTDDQIRLLEIDRTWGPRDWREFKIQNNMGLSVKKNGLTVVEVEAEAAVIRAKL